MCLGTCVLVFGDLCACVWGPGCLCLGTCVLVFGDLCACVWGPVCLCLGTCVLVFGDLGAHACDPFAQVRPPSMIPACFLFCCLICWKWGGVGGAVAGGTGLPPCDLRGLCQSCVCACVCVCVSVLILSCVCVCVCLACVCLVCVCVCVHACAPPPFPPLPALPSPPFLPSLPSPCTPVPQGGGGPRPRGCYPWVGRQRQRPLDLLPLPRCALHPGGCLQRGRHGRFHPGLHRRRAA